MPRKQTQSQCLSQKSSSRKKTSQTTLEQCLNGIENTSSNLDDYVNKCVRYIIYRAGSNLPLRKADLQKNVLPNIGKRYERVMQEVGTVLKDVYGFNFCVCEQTSTIKQYILCNKFNSTLESDTHDQPKNLTKVLIMLILAHVFMSDSVITESSLMSFLKSLKIDPEHKHESFGDIKEFINNTMVKQKYLNIGTDQSTRKVSYTWGPRAENEMSKYKLLEFVAKVYGDRTPQSFTTQFEAANIQTRETNIIGENGVGNVQEEEGF